MEVSVPFPGILFLNASPFIFFKLKEDSFRPLPGDLISQLNQKKMDELSEVGGFRPLPGDLISQLVMLNIKSIVKNPFPSPSRGSYFSIRTHDNNKKR